MMTEIPMRTDNTTHRLGTWAHVLFHTPEPEYRPFWSAMICCPECGKYLNAVNHTISADGQITPSLGHPSEYGPCSWHTSPRLIGWFLRPLPDIPAPATCARCGTVAHTIGGWGTWSGGTGIICEKCRPLHNEECAQAIAALSSEADKR